MKEELTNNEIIQRIDALLNQHVTGIRGYIGEGANRGDFFALFAEAYCNRGLAKQSEFYITSDGLVEDLSCRSFQVDSEENYRRKVILIRQLGAMWKEWDFAWTMHGVFYTLER